MFRDCGSAVLRATAFDPVSVSRMLKTAHTNFVELTVYNRDSGIRTKL